MLVPWLMRTMIGIVVTCGFLVIMSIAIVSSATETGPALFGILITSFGVVGK
jgi:hypothetical protein